MSPANVECAGGGQWARQRVPYGQLPRFQLVPTGGKPCRWKGKRGGAFPDHWIRLNPTVLTTKPCPQCGGKVKLIQPQPSP